MLVKEDKIIIDLKITIVKRTDFIDVLVISTLQSIEWMLTN